MSALLGETAPDWVGQMLGTGYFQFSSPAGIDGLAKDSGERLDILAVIARNPGHGEFRKFIADAKREYKTICIWEDWNPMVGEILARYGFQPVTETQDDGEVLEGWKYEAAKQGRRG